jgi:hypothetical protein
MVHLIWKMHQKVYSIGKRLKMKKNENFIFHLLFEQGSLIWPTLTCLCPHHTLWYTTLF